MDLTKRENWLQWRQKGIGSSDAPIIHDESPYKNRHELYLAKVEPQTFNGEEKENNSYIAWRGHELEPIIRKRWATIAALELGIESTWLPLSVDGGGKVMRASLDGCTTTDENKIIAEFKFQGKEAHELIKQKTAPRHYWIQVQHQLLVSGAKKAYLVSYNPELDTLNYMEILADTAFHNDHIKKCKEFWSEVMAKTPSAHTLSFKKDERKEADAQLLILAKSYVDLSAKIKADEEELEKMKTKLIEAAGKADKVDFEFVTVTKAVRAGSISYSTIPEVIALSKEYIANFKKPDVEYYTVKVKK